jgi:hypothetical protein
MVREAGPEDEVEGKTREQNQQPFHLRFSSLDLLAEEVGWFGKIFERLKLRLKFRTTGQHLCISLVHVASVSSREGVESMMRPSVTFGSSPSAIALRTCFKANPTLIVDADAVLTLTVGARCLEPVAGQRDEITEGRSSLHTIKLEACKPFKA